MGNRGATRLGLAMSSTCGTLEKAGGRQYQLTGVVGRDFYQVLLNNVEDILASTYHLTGIYSPLYNTPMYKEELITI